jgi:hypothetical protein
MAEITGTLEAIYSRRNKNGNCRWAMRYTDHETGKVVCGTVCGGESNIHGILQHWNNPDGWDRSVKFDVWDMAILEFNSMTKAWDHAGCRPEDLAAFIREKLQLKEVPTD